MVMINKEDQDRVRVQDRVTCFIEQMEHELCLLRGLLDDITHCSDQKGFLQVGDTVEVLKKAETPNESSVVVKRAKVVSLDYCITNLQLEKVEKGASEETIVQMVEDFDWKDYDFRKVDPGDGDDESDDESEEISRFEPDYHDVLNEDTD